MDAQSLANATRNRSLGKRSAISLVELLVVIAISTLLVTMLLPAVHMARASARNAQCASNLRQFGVGFSAYMEKRDAFCSGAFDWKYDGPVTEVGWVADLRKLNVATGLMLCPSNPAQLSSTFEDLLNADKDDLGECVDHEGTDTIVHLDGTLRANPCYQILNEPEKYSPGSEARKELIITAILNENINTNYTASWLMVRSRPRLDRHGNIASERSGCPPDVKHRPSTFGPLESRWVDAAAAPLSIIPLVGDGAIAGTLSTDLGPHTQGSEYVGSFTAGPAKKTTFETPEFAEGTPQGGPNGWWEVWKKNTLQDYRNFGMMHRRACNILMADGSVRVFHDENNDGFLNNGFSELSHGVDPEEAIEAPAEKLFSGAAVSGI